MAVSLSPCQVAAIVGRFEDGWRNAGLTLGQVADVLAVLFPVKSLKHGRDKCDVCPVPELTDDQIERLAWRLENKWADLDIADDDRPAVLHLISPVHFPLDWTTDGTSPERRKAREVVCWAGGPRPTGAHYHPEHYASTRTCLGQCGKTLPIGHFGKRRNGPGGRATRCRVCEVLRVHEYDKRIKRKTGERRRTRG